MPTGTGVAIICPLVTYLVGVPSVVLAGRVAHPFGTFNFATVVAGTAVASLLPLISNLVGETIVVFT